MKDLSGKYVKYGDFYIKYGEDGLPDYGFIVKGTTIEKFVNLRDDRNLEEIILPPIITKKLDAVTNKQEYIYSLKSKDISVIKIKTEMINYISNGYVTISNECFKGLRNKKIVVKTEYPIKIHNNAFLDCENMTFVIPNNHSIYWVHHFCFSGGLHDAYWNLDGEWYIIDRKNFPTKAIKLWECSYIDGSEYYLYEFDRQFEIAPTTKIEHLPEPAKKEESSENMYKDKISKQAYKIIDEKL